MSRASALEINNCKSELGFGPLEDCGSQTVGNREQIIRFADFVQSPSLRSSGKGVLPAYEMKFLVEENLALDVEALIQRDLTPDPHGDPQYGHAYRTTTLYCDTPQFDVFHRVESHKHLKFRLRRYGAEPWVFLERKTKCGQRVRKRRTTARHDELGQLGNPSPPADWNGRWYYEQLRRRELQPVLSVTYVRQAYIGACEQGPLRVTFDRNVCGAPAADWELNQVNDGVPVLAGQVICEFKFQGALPAKFKAVIAALHLTPTSVSKYRHCLRASGLAD